MASEVVQGMRVSKMNTNYMIRVFADNHKEIRRHKSPNHFTLPYSQGRQEGKGKGHNKCVFVQEVLYKKSWVGE